MVDIEDYDCPFTFLKDARKYGADFALEWLLELEIESVHQELIDLVKIYGFEKYYCCDKLCYRKSFDHYHYRPKKELIYA